MILDATKGECILDPDAAARQQAEARICELQRENAEMRVLGTASPATPGTAQPFELLANCFGPEDIDTAMQSGARGVGPAAQQLHDAARAAFWTSRNSSISILPALQRHRAAL